MTKNYFKVKNAMDKLTANFTASALNAARILSEISFTIIKARAEKNMKQKEFASFMGVSQGMISKWESGDYNFTIKQMCDICEKLSLTPDITFEQPEAKLRNIYTFEKNGLENDGTYSNFADSKGALAA